ncbi:RVP_2 domain-containing protein [Cephalotus follicularis]|uniref:RVP_2 domain-containing protein n=1 Tax=Cephalotus follicularis TaxID=3775 RepID=A0A1Q3BLX2_CEPFO|nr:RVP_2 domain-containing protein [Cephalotus follicularis]
MSLAAKIPSSFNNDTSKNPNTSTQHSFAASSLPVRRMSPAELRIRREKWLCYNCEEKFHPGHKCKPQFSLLIGEDEMENSLVYDQQDIPELSDTQEYPDTTEPEINMNALSGQLSANSLRLTGKHHNHSVHVLVDTGSTHNFIRPDTTTSLKLPISPCSPFKVKIGNGESLWGNSKCIGVQLQIQGHPFIIDLFILDIYGAEIVLGTQWLPLLGPIVSDYKQMTMSFNWKDKPILLIGESPFNTNPLSFKHLHKLTSNDAIASLYQLTVVEISTSPTSLNEPVPTESQLF